MPYGHQTRMEREPDSIYFIVGTKIHAGVIPGQLKVISLRNVLWQPNLIGKIHEKSTTHCSAKQSRSGDSTLTDVNLLRNKGWPERNALLGQRLNMDC